MKRQMNKLSVSCQDAECILRVSDVLPGAAQVFFALRFFFFVFFFTHSPICERNG